MHKSVLLDTSFFLRFLNENDILFKNTIDYYNFFIKEEYNLVISTIAIAEYCVKGSVDELPLKNMQVLPFNFYHAIRAGKFAKILFEAKKKKSILLKERLIIPNDTKLFAQADAHESIEYFLTSDSECLKVFNFLNQNTEVNFNIININTDITQSNLSKKSRLTNDQFNMGF